MLKSIVVGLLVALCLLLGLAAALHGGGSATLPTSQPWWIDTLIKLLDAFTRVLTPLIWPVVALIALFLLRPHFGVFVAKLEEATFGGMTLKFGKILDEAAHAAAVAESEAKALPGKPPAPASPKIAMDSVIVEPDGLALKVMVSNPQDGIIAAYNSLLSAVRGLGKRLDIKVEYYSGIISILYETGKINEPTLNLLRRLSDMYEYADGSGLSFVSKEQARTYRRLVNQALLLINEIK